MERENNSNKTANKEQQQTSSSLTPATTTEETTGVTDTSKARGRKRKKSSKPPKCRKKSKSSTLPGESLDKWKNIINSPFVGEREVKCAELEGYGVIECFTRWGWQANLGFSMPKIYEKEVKQWMSTLTMSRGNNPPLTMSLTGKVDGKEATLTMDAMKKVAEFDTGVEMPPDAESNQRPYEYKYLSEKELFGEGKENSNEWHGMINTLFNLPSDDTTDLRRNRLRPLANVLSKIVNHNILPRSSDLRSIRNYEVPLLHALFTGNPPLSFTNIAMLNIWAAHEHPQKTIIPHAGLISDFLWHSGVVPKEATLSHIANTKVCKDSFVDLKFSVESRFYSITSNVTGEIYKVPKPAAVVGDTEETVNTTDTQSHNRQFTRFQQQLWDRQEQLFAEMRKHMDERMDRFEQLHKKSWSLHAEYAITQAYMAECYQQKAWLYRESVRHHQDFVAKRSYEKDHSPVEYQNLTYSADMQIPPYPGTSPPRFYRSPPADPPPSSSQTPAPFDKAPNMQKFYESLFSYDSDAGNSR